MISAVLLFLAILNAGASKVNYNMQNYPTAVFCGFASGFALSGAFSLFLAG